jgi:hypothetical protein
VPARARSLALETADWGVGGPAVHTQAALWSRDFALRPAILGARTSPFVNGGDTGLLARRLPSQSLGSARSRVRADANERANACATRGEKKIELCVCVCVVGRSVGRTDLEQPRTSFREIIF